MPQNSMKWISHRLDGGWATDYGTVSHAAPDGSGIVSIPWLNDARNIIYTLDGGVQKMPGTATLNGSALESSATITGLYDYWRQGTLGAPIQKRVIHVGTKIKADNADGVFADIGTGFQSGAVPQYSTFDDLLIIANDASADVPKSWDQTTFQSLAGSPPNFSYSIPHKNRQWGAGVISAPSRLYYSVNLNPEDWTSTGSGSIDVSPDDGDMITGIYSFKNELIIFKGPYRGSIWRLQGSSSSDFTLVPFIQGIGAAWQNSLFSLPNDLGFISPRGTIHSLVATQNFGDYTRSSLSFPINRVLQSTLAPNYARKWWAATDMDSGYSLISITPSGQSTNTQLLMADFRFVTLGEPYPRWARWDTYSAACLAPVIDTGNRLRVFAGGYDGYVYKLDQEDRTHNGGAISAIAQTPFLDYGAEHVMKTLYAVGIQLDPQNDNALTFKWLRDGQTEQSTTVTQGGSSILGPWSANVFTLDSSTLGGTRFLPRYIELEEGGEFRAIRYTVQDTTVASDMKIHGLSTAMTGGSVSTEN